METYQQEYESDMSLPCRLCANNSAKIMGIFSSEGISNDLPNKMSQHLHIQVSENDSLPLQCCLVCVSTLVSWHEFFLSCAEADIKLQDQYSVEMKVFEEAEYKEEDIETEHVKLENYMDVQTNEGTSQEELEPELFESEANLEFVKTEEDVEDFVEEPSGSDILQGSCELCDEKFKTNSGLKVHMHRKHGELKRPRKTPKAKDHDDDDEDAVSSKKSKNADSNASLAIKKSKRIYNTWKPEDMVEALNKLSNGDIGFNEAHRRYKIPKPTLRRHLLGLNKYPTLIGRHKDLNENVEKELVKHALTLQSNFFGLTATDIRKLAFQLAEKYNLPHRFDKAERIAGRKWYYRFIRDNPCLSLRTPEPTSVAKATGLNKERVYEFFARYESILDECKFNANQIYNVVGTGLLTDPSKIISQIDGEMGLVNTCVCCTNTAGEFIPPMLIFKRANMNDDLKKGAPPGTVFACSKNGLITSELFVEWLMHFIKYIKLEKSEKKQILLLLDGHTIHTKTLEAIQLACEYGITMLSFPAHTIHRLQPLDRAFSKTLQVNYIEASSVWLKTNPGNTIKQTIISELMGIAYTKSVHVEIGFKSTGLWPCDRNIFRDEDYYSASVPEQRNEMPERENQENVAPIDSTATSSTI